MSFLCHSLFVTLAAASAVVANPLSPRGIINEYLDLLTKCLTADPGTYVAVKYADGTYVNYKYDECYPYALPGKPNVIAKQAVFCRAVSCTNRPHSDCSGASFPPVPITVPPGLTLVNVADFVHLIGQAAICSESPL